MRSLTFRWRRPNTPYTNGHDNKRAFVRGCARLKTNRFFHLVQATVKPSTDRSEKRPFTCRLRGKFSLDFYRRPDPTRRLCSFATHAHPHATRTRPLRSVRSGSEPFSSAPTTRYLAARRPSADRGDRIGYRPDRRRTGLPFSGAINRNA